MTSEDKAHFNNLFEGLRLDIRGIKSDVSGVKSDVSTMSTEIHTISRGVYGDEKNGVKGLIQTNQEQQSDIDILKLDKKKLIWTVCGAFIVVELIIQGFKLLA